MQLDITSDSVALRLMNEVSESMSDDYLNMTIREFRNIYQDKIKVLKSYKNISPMLIGCIETEMCHYIGVLANKDIPSIIHTYLVYNKSNGLHKIGKSIDVGKRIIQLQVATGADLELILVIEKNVERELHKELKGSHVHGEWFRLGISEIEFIKSYMK
jgi:hypothetical protein